MTSKPNANLDFRMNDGTCPAENAPIAAALADVSRAGAAARETYWESHRQP